MRDLGESAAAADSAASALADALKCDWRAASDLSEPDRALCAYAEKATRAPATCGAADVDALRAAGFDDVAIHDAVQVIAYFNYINRVADCLGVDLEPEMTRPA